MEKEYEKIKSFKGEGIKTYIIHFSMEKQKFDIVEDYWRDYSKYDFYFTLHYEDMPSFEVAFQKMLENAGLHKAIILSNGEYLKEDYGKYSPNLTFVVGFEDIPYYKYLELDNILDNINIKWDGEATVMYGDYWVSKKGTRCFRPRKKGDASHMLVKVSWQKGGERSTSGKNPEAEKYALYHRYARSNGGGTGNTYYVFEAGFVRPVSLEDI